MTPDPYIQFSSKMHSSMKAMRNDMMNAPMTGYVDHDFVAKMIPHHQAAIDMARNYLKNAKDPEIKKQDEKLWPLRRKNEIFWKLVEIT